MWASILGSNQFEVTYEDGEPVVVTVGPLDSLAWEDSHGKPLGRPSSRAFFWLVHHALQRQGSDVGDFDVWVARVVSLRMEVEPAADPTGGTPSPTRGSSRRSPSKPDSTLSG